MPFHYPKQIVRRDSYLAKLRPFIGKQLIKVLTGQRRVGKSYLLFQLMQHIVGENPEANIIYINKEDLAFDGLKTAADLHRYVGEQLKAEAENYVFIDEIQEVEAFEKALRSLLLLPNVDLYCTGSNAAMLSGELASGLSGRYVECTVHSLSYQEFLQFHHLADSDESLDKYLKFGGLPYLMHLPLVDEVVFEYLKNVYNTIVYRDLIDRHHLRNTGLLERLVLFLADNVGSIFSAKKISDYVKSQQVNAAPHQIQLLTDYLAQAFLIHKVPRYDLAGKRIFEFGEKFYFENLGIRHALWGYKPQDMGKIVENAVYNHLIYCGYQVKTGALHTREIDFVCERQGEKMYVQVALRLSAEDTIKREFGNLMHIADHYPKRVVTLDPFTGNSYEGIGHSPLRAFLRSPL